MRTLTKITGLLTAVALLEVGFSGRVAAAEVSTNKQGSTAPAHVFAQVGVGFVELGHAEVGAFVTPHLTIEAMATWAGVFGAHYGGGIMYSVGEAQGRRPPRHAFLVGARLMLDPDLTFKSGGDSLGSYGVIPIGYGYLADSGLYLRATAGLVLLGSRGESSAPVGPPQETGTRLVVSGPMFTLALGFAF